MRSLNCVECGKAVLQMFWVDTRNFTTVKVWTQHLLKYFMWLHIWYRFLAVLYCLFWMVMSLSRCTICKLRILIHCRNKTVGYPDKFSSYELWDNYLRQRRRYMFARVHLSVCLLARLLRNACMDLDEILRVDRCRDVDELINFWAWSGL